jgi:hypothetical protein
MKIRLPQQLYKYGIPGGEGSIALPISFINVIARKALVGRSNLLVDLEIASSLKLLAMTG